MQIWPTQRSLNSIFRYHRFAMVSRFWTHWQMLCQSQHSSFPYFGYCMVLLCFKGLSPDPIQDTVSPHLPSTQRSILGFWNTRSIAVIQQLVMYNSLPKELRYASNVNVDFFFQKTQSGLLVFLRLENVPGLAKISSLLLNRNLRWTQGKENSKPVNFKDNIQRKWYLWAWCIKSLSIFIS